MPLISIRSTATEKTMSLEAYEADSPSDDIDYSISLNFSFSVSTQNVDIPSGIPVLSELTYPTVYLSAPGISIFSAEIISIRPIEAEGEAKITLNEDEGFTVPAEGGRAYYDVALSNFEPGTILRQWSIITKPNGDHFPMHKLRKLNEIDSNGELYFDNRYLNIPDWFEAGEYTLTWYLIDTETQEQVESTMNFIKIEE